MDAIEAAELKAGDWVLLGSFEDQPEQRVELYDTDDLFELGVFNGSVFYRDVKDDYTDDGEREFEPEHIIRKLTPDEILKVKTFISCHSAVLNGYELWTSSAEDIANDMI